MVKALAIGIQSYEVLPSGSGVKLIVDEINIARQTVLEQLLAANVQVTRLEVGYTNIGGSVYGGGERSLSKWLVLYKKEWLEISAYKLYGYLLYLFCLVPCSRSQPTPAGNSGERR